jgi:hypothetical protein
MTVKWVKGYTPDHLCQILEGAKAMDENGKASLQGFDFAYNVVVLSSMVSFDRNIPEVEKRKIVSEATFNAGSQGKITQESLLGEMDKLAKQYLQTSPNKYVLVTSLSISHVINLKRQSINGCIITFRPAIPNKFKKEIEKIKKRASNNIYGEFPRDYLIVKITVKAKSYSEAGDKAIDAIDLLRGIWNLFYNRQHPYRISYGSKKPVNRIVLGPLHTLHFPNASLATKSWWYEPDYRGPLEAIDPSKEINDLYKFQGHIRKLLQQSPFRVFLESAIIRYTRALDLRDWDNAFLRLWGVLETLTHTNENDTHKVTVKRSSFLYKDREYATQILYHLRDYRNRAVHVGSGNQDIETFIYQLKDYVETALEFLIKNKYGLNNLNEIAQFMDLPTERTILNNRVKLINSALKFTGN